MKTSSATATAVQPPRTSVGGDGDPKPASIKTTFDGMRRSCELCRRHKKKCDGGRPCRRCFRTRHECTYKLRSWHQPHARQQLSGEYQQREPQRTHSRKVQLIQVLQHSTCGAVLGHCGMLPFKRCRLSASPATGLVGMQENGFLTDFFGCIGFLPLTTQSHIREAMVKIMLSPVSRRPSGFGDGCGEAGQVDAIAMSGRVGETLGEEGLSTGPSTCIFWCAVALGALVKGSPIESVSSYTKLATEALAKSYSGPADAEIARAWAMVGYLYGFMGDLAKFREYLAISATFMTSSIEQGSADALPLGFAEIIQHREIGDPSHQNVDAVFSREQAFPQLNTGASEHELYQYVMQSLHVFERATYARMLKQTDAAENDSVGSVQTAGECTRDRDRPHLNGVPEPHEVSEAMASVWSQDNTVLFGPLEDAVDRPSIRTGMGGILINGVLVFDTAARGDVCGTLKRIGRCVEVFERYPGLSRSVMGAHWVHIMSAALTALNVSGAREMYDMLRGAYNPFRPPGSPPIPPLEEWQGLAAVCEDTYCRAVEGLIAKCTMTAFSNPADRSGACDITEDKSDKLLDLAVAGQNQSHAFTASATPDEEVGCIPPPCSPETSWGGSNLSNACVSHSGPCSVADDGSNRSESVREAKAPGSCTPRSLTPICFDHEAMPDGGLDVGGENDDRVLGGSAAPHEALTMISAGLGGEAVDEVEEDDVAAADWLDVTTALLDAGNGSEGVRSG